ncbi:MAG: hypothetical protein ACREVN_12640 [Gammaproteobacteria bacterium]
MNQDRRQALVLLGALGGLALLPMRDPFAAEPPEPLARFKGSLDAESAARLGRAYLKAHPDEADGGRLLDTILDGAGQSTDLPRYLSEKARTDFEAGRVIELNDWQVSETEARIFAAVALTG